MENNKYYVPEISEFHIGFEYYMPILRETKDGYLESEQLLHTWTERCHMPNLFDVNYENGGKITVISVPDCLKVKYLDRGDVESLGFVYDEKNDLYKKEIDYDHCVIHQYYDNNILLHLNKNNIVDIHNGGQYEDNHGVTLIIKNKSELKKALKQLGL